MKAPLALPNRKRLQQVMANADLLHVQFPFFLGHGAIAEARRQGKPVVMSFHVQPENILSNLGITSPWLTRVLYRFFVWRFYSRADRVIAPSQFAADLLQDAGLKKSVSVLSNGVTEDFFLQRDPTKTAPPYDVVSVGRLAKEKQQPQLIHAVAASKHMKDIRLTLAGTGPQQQKLAALADDLGVNAEIGRVSDERLKALYQTADLFVQTSAVELEGMSVLEAMAAGCPVLVNNSSTSAVPEFVTAQEATYAMNDVAELTSKLDAMLDSQAVRAAAGVENRAVARRRHHERSTQTLAELYAGVLSVAASGS
jgi:glycosyltransferase involved in cell wall biosynthesis